MPVERETVEVKVFKREIKIDIEGKDHPLYGCQLQISIPTAVKGEEQERMRDGENWAATAKLIAPSEEAVVERKVWATAFLTFDEEGDDAWRLVAGKVSEKTVKSKGAVILGRGPEKASMPHLRLEEECPSHLQDNAALAVVKGLFQEIITKGYISPDVVAVAEVLSYAPDGVNLNRHFRNALSSLGFEKTGPGTLNVVMVKECLFPEVVAELARQREALQGLFLNTFQAYIASRIGDAEREQQSKAFEKTFEELRFSLAEAVPVDIVDSFCQELRTLFEKGEFTEALSAQLNLEPEQALVVLKILAGDWEIAEGSKFMKQPAIKNLQKLVVRAEELEKERAVQLPELKKDWLLQVVDAWITAQDSGNPSEAFTEASDSILEEIVAQFPWAAEEAEGIVAVARKAITEGVDLEEVAAPLIGRPEARVLFLLYARSRKEVPEAETTLRDAFNQRGAHSLEIIRALEQAKTLKRKKDWLTGESEGSEFIVKTTGLKGEEAIRSIKQKRQLEADRYQFQAVLDFSPETTIAEAEMERLAEVKIAVTERKTGDYTTFDLVNPDFVLPDREDALAFGYLGQLGQSVILGDGYVLRLRSNFDAEGNYRHSLFELQSIKSKALKGSFLDFLQEDVASAMNSYIDGNRDVSWNPQISVSQIRPVEVAGQIFFEMAITTADGQAETLFVPTRIDLPRFLAESTPLLAERLPTVFSKPVLGI